MGQSQPGQYSSWTKAQDVCPETDCKGWCVIITGANTGIGLEAARVFALRGAQVIIGCRSKQRGDEAVEKLKRLVPGGSVEFSELDLASFVSIQRFATAFNTRNIPLKLLINNAGIMMIPKFTVTEQKIEQQFGVNHLGHYLLTTLLLPQLRAGAPSRVVNVSSYAHTFAKNTVTFPPQEQNYDGGANYSISKLANILFARELNTREEKNGVHAYSLHPGVIATELSRNSTMAGVFYTMAKPFLKSIEQGAATTMFCALDNRAVAGGYHADCAPATCTKLAQDAAQQAALWKMSEDFCNNWLANSDANSTKN